jgi:hypothetical protein
MINQLYPPNGTEPAQQVIDITSSPVLPRRATVPQIVEVLQRDHGVSDGLVEQLGEAFGRAATRVVDDVVRGRQQQAIVGYHVVRQLDGDKWWKR